MAGDKVVPLRLGEGGPVIGTAKIDENGFAMAEITDLEVAHKLFPQELYLSVSVKAEPENGG